MKTAVDEMEQIKEILPMLSKTALRELRTFTDYLADREKRRKTFAKQLGKIEKESDTLTFDSVDDAMKTIRNWKE